MLICVFVKISTNPSPRVRSWPWRLHEGGVRVQGGRGFFFSSRGFAALSSGEKSRKTSGTRIEMSTISVFFSALIPKGLLVQVAVQNRWSAISVWCYVIFLCLNVAQRFPTCTELSAIWAHYICDIQKPSSIFPYETYKCLAMVYA